MTGRHSILSENRRKNTHTKHLDIAVTITKKTKRLNFLLILTLSCDLMAHE